MSTTRTIEKVLSEESSLIQKDKSKDHYVSCAIKPLVATQVAYNLINSLAKTGYTSAILITDLAGLEPVFLGMSTVGISISIPLAIAFALAEAYAHRSESEHFNHSNDDDHEEIHVHSPKPPLTWFQNACAFLHFTSDCAEGTSIPLLFSKMAGIDNAGFLIKGCTYAGIGLYSFFGNAQEYVNTRIAFQNANQRAEEQRGRINQV